MSFEYMNGPNHHPSGAYYRNQADLARAAALEASNHGLDYMFEVYMNLAMEWEKLALSPEQQVAGLSSHFMGDAGKAAGPALP